MNALDLLIKKNRIEKKITDTHIAPKTFFYIRSPRLITCLKIIHFIKQEFQNKNPYIDLFIRAVVYKPMCNSIPIIETQFTIKKHLYLKNIFFTNNVNRLFCV